MGKQGIAYKFLRCIDGVQLMGSHLCPRFINAFRKGNDELSLNIISGSFFFGSLVLAWAAFHAIKAHICGCLCYFVLEPLIAFRCNRSWQSLSFSVPKLVRQKSKSFGRQASHLQLGMRANLGCALLWETSRVVRPKFGLWFRLWRISIKVDHSVLLWMVDTGCSWKGSVLRWATLLLH